MHEAFRAYDEDAFVGMITRVRLFRDSLPDTGPECERDVKAVFIECLRGSVHRGRLRGVQILGSRNLSKHPHWTGVIDIRGDKLQHMRGLVHGGTACAGINKFDVTNPALCDISLQFYSFSDEN